jgi:hypothetical protein
MSASRDFRSSFCTGDSVGEGDTCDDIAPALTGPLRAELLMTTGEGCAEKRAIAAGVACALDVGAAEVAGTPCAGEASTF